MIKKMIGWKDVYQFTFTQKVKGKGFKILTIIILLLSLLSMPLISIITQPKESSTSIETVYMMLDIEGIEKEKFLEDVKNVTNKNELYARLEYSLEDVSSYEKISKEIKKSDDQYKKIALMISYSSQGMVVQYLYGENTGVGESDINQFKDFFGAGLTDLLVDNLAITQEQYDYINTPITKEIVKLGVDGEKINDGGTVPLDMGLYGLGCFIFAILAFVLSINAESITASIIAEKASRVIEYIMISIRPMAIVAGKVLAMLTITFLEVIIFIIGLIISVMINPTGLPQWLSLYIQNIGLNEVGVIQIILAIVITVLGFLLYSVIAALLGATVSKLEEATEASKLYMTFMLVGIYMSIALIMLQMFGVDVGIYEKIVFLVPFSAAVALPFYLVIGKASIVIALISIVITLISLVIVIQFVSKVYGYIIYHNGSPIKIRELFKISKELRQGENNYGQ